MSPNMLGALIMMASMACFTINDAMIKLTLGPIPLMQLLFLRGLLTTIMILLLARALGQLRFNIPRQDWGRIAMRSFSEVAAAYFFLSALQHMPLANVTAILQVLPLTVSLGAALFLQEPLGWRRLLAIGIGFVGMLLIVRPGAEGFSTWSIYALIAVFFVTTRDLATRRISKDVPGLTVTLCASILVVLFFGTASLFIEWQPVDAYNGSLIVGAAVVVMGAYYFSVQTMRVGEIGFIAPFRYTSLIWALVLGLVIFGDYPDRLPLIGAAIVVSTGLFTLYRERLAQAKA